MSLQAYQRATQRAESPRQAEYRLFGEVTRALIAAAELDELNFGGRMEALDWNRRLWSTMAQDCARPDNGLPTELRASIISLSLWVDRHTRLVIGRQERFEPLIELNRTMMQGLAGEASAA